MFAFIIRRNSQEPLNDNLKCPFYSGPSTWKLLIQDEIIAECVWTYFLALPTFAAYGQKEGVFFSEALSHLSDTGSVFSQPCCWAHDFFGIYIQVGDNAPALTWELMSVLGSSQEGFFHCFIYKGTKKQVNNAQKPCCDFRLDYHFRK